MRTKTLVIAVLLFMATVALSQEPANSTADLSAEDKELLLKYCPGGDGYFILDENGKQKTSPDGQRMIACPSASKKPVEPKKTAAKSVVMVQPKKLTPAQVNYLLQNEDFKKQVAEIAGSKLQPPIEISDEDFNKRATSWLNSLKEGSPELERVRKLFEPKNGVATKEDVNNVRFWNKLMTIPLWIGFIGLIITSFFWRRIFGIPKAEAEETGEEECENETEPVKPGVTSVGPAEVPVRLPSADQKFQEEIRQEIAAAAKAFANDPTFTRVVANSNAMGERVTKVEEAVKNLGEQVANVAGDVSEIKVIFTTIADGIAKAGKKKSAAKTANP